MREEGRRKGRIDGLGGGLDLVFSLGFSGVFFRSGVGRCGGREV